LHGNIKTPVGCNVRELIRQIEAFQHVCKTKGTKACPASWKSGKPTLEAGPALIGKVWQ